MKVSVILPVYNIEKYVGECIESVLNQTYGDFELIAINDGSTDSSSAVLENYHDRIKIIQQSNQGLARALNKGLEEASGDYVAFIDGDDLWATDKLETQIGILDKHPEIEATFAEMEQFLSPELKNQEQRFRFEKGPLSGFMKITMMARRDVFSKYGNFPDVEVGEFILWFDSSRTKGLNVYQSKHVLAYRRIRENSLSQDSSYYPGLLRMLKNRIDAKRS